ncbi:hypothetical protein Dxin01_00166 [Deinococcus xinjiangensis]|uniref:Uncharacterized protein n=1 Tax=Deinococcus xinjiangensis TaxID=457454 RepID=A0ABP9V579_9DEIO
MTTLIVTLYAVIAVCAFLALYLAAKKSYSAVGPAISAETHDWAIEREAERIVREKEQDIKTGRLDRASAESTAVADLTELYPLTNKQARRFILSSLNRLNTGGLVS